MKRLSAQDFNLTVKAFKAKARPLERALFDYYFESANPNDVLHALTPYQNADGGFGHGIEPDVSMPDSFAIGTTIGLAILHELPLNDQVVACIDKAFAYLSRTYDVRRKGWWAAGVSVNDWPHAPWWRADAKGATVLDNNWGNPSAEVLGYFARWHEDQGESAFKDQLDHAIHNLSQEPGASEHELFCYIQAYPHLSSQRQVQLEPLISKRIGSLLNMNLEEWGNYVPKPLDFLPSPMTTSFGISQHQIDMHLDYLVDYLSVNHSLHTTWQWGQYPEAWDKAKVAWEAILTLKALKTLRAYGRLMA